MNKCQKPVWYACMFAKLATHDQPLVFLFVAETITRSSWSESRRLEFGILSKMTTLCSTVVVPTDIMHPVTHELFQNKGCFFHKHGNKRYLSNTWCDVFHCQGWEKNILSTTTKVCKIKSHLYKDHWSVWCLFGLRLGFWLGPSFFELRFVFWLGLSLFELRLLACFEPFWT